MDIVVIIIDTLRFDCIGYQSEKRHLHRYGVSEYLETPTLDGLAGKGICFTNAFSASTLTCPSISTIFTGLYPPEHGVRVHGIDKLHNSVFTLPEILKAAGYVTVLYSDDGILFDIPDLTKRFDHVLYSDNLFLGGNNMQDVFENAESGNEKTLMSLISQIKASDKPVFLVYHVMDVHSPYMYSDYAVHKGYNRAYLQEMEKLAAKHNKRFEKKNQWELWLDIAGDINYNIEDLFPLYVRGVSKFDKNRLKNFMDNLVKVIDIDRNLFFILSDHGEGRCDEEIDTYFNHGGLLRDEIIRIPLIMIHPDYGHEIVDHHVSTVDITPTILELIRARPNLDYSFAGDSLLNSRPYIYCEQWCNDSHEPTSVTEAVLFQRCIRTGERKYIVYGQSEDIYVNPQYCNHLSNDEFMKKISKDLFYITEYPRQIQTSCKRDLIELNKRREVWMEELGSGKKTKEEVIMEALDVHNNFSKKIEIYDLQNDFFEENPIDPFINRDSAFKSCIYLSKILSISNSLASGALKEKPESSKPADFYVSGYDLEEKENKSIEIIKEAVNPENAF